MESDRGSSLFLLLLLLFSSLFSNSLVSLVDLFDSESSVGLDLLELLKLGNSDGLFSSSLLGEGQDFSLDVLDSILIEVTVVDQSLLWLSSGQWLQGQFADEGQKSLSVSLKRLLTSVLSSVVNSDSN